MRQKLRFFRSILCFLAALLLTAAVFPSASSAERDAVTELISGMSAEDKIAQMLVVSFGSYENQSGSQVLSSAAAQALGRHCFGGVILFSQNVAVTADAVRLIDSMQLANASGGSSRPQLFAMADQEGGNITRLGHGTATPGNMALGASGSTDDAERVGALIGSELKAVGIGVCLAPSLDVNSNPSNPVIGVRSYSDSPQLVSSLGKSFMRRLTGTGVISCVKHFPGHGDTDTDSHTGLPCVNKNLSQLESCEFVPFRSCISAGAEMVMTAHIQFPLVDSERYTTADGRSIALPATLSKTMITDILRGSLGFDGVVITDAMMMDAIADNFGIIEASRLAIEAGVDMLLQPVNAYGSSGIAQLESYIETMAGLLRNGELSQAKVDAALRRILVLKQRKGLLSPYSGADLSERVRNAESTVGSAAHHTLEWSITKKTITLVKNERNTLPISGSTGRTVILTASEAQIRSVQYAVSLLIGDGKLPQGADIDVLTYDEASYDQLAPRLAGADELVILTRLKSAAGLRSSTSRLIDRLIALIHSNGGRCTIVSTQLPYDCARFADADAVMLAYCPKAMPETPRPGSAPAEYGPNIPVAIYMLFDAQARFTARLPVSIPALNSEHYYTSSTLYARGFGLTYQQQPPQTSVPETAAPQTEAPATEVPPTDTASSAAPTGDISVTEVPETSMPGTETPETPSSGTDLPNTGVPASPAFTDVPTATPGVSNMPELIPQDNFTADPLGLSGYKVTPAAVFGIAGAAALLTAGIVLFIKSRRKR